MIEIFYLYELNPDNDLNDNLDDFIKKVMGLLWAKKKLANVVYVENKRQKVKDLVEKYNYKTRINSILNYFIILSFILTYPLFKFLASSLVQINDINYWLVYKKIHHFMEMMKDLALLVYFL